MKIARAQEMRDAEERLFRSVDPYAVMECAGRVFVDTLSELGLLGKRFLVLCGEGNNGGDGFVIARLLHHLGQDVVVSFDGTPSSDSAHKAWLSFQELGTKTISAPSEFIGSSPEVIIDALYGIGFHGVLPESAVRWVRFSDECRSGGSKLVAVDIPSGVHADTGQVDGAAFTADYTITFQSLKPGQLFFPGTSRCGEVIVRDLGIPLDTIKRTLLERRAVERILKPLSSRDSHKGSRGAIAVIGGSDGMFGAPILAGYGALRCGAGTVTVFLPEGGAHAALSAHPELMVRLLTDSPELPGVQALIVGPGMGKLRGELLKDLFERYGDTPTVIDADALNILSEERSLLSRLPKESVLTPHPGEAARLIGVTTSEIQQDRLRAAEKLAELTGRTVVLKGARTVIGSPTGEMCVCAAASEVLGTAGSGDVLAGVIGALLARGLTPLQSAQVGVFSHGEVGMIRGGDIAGLTASDLLAEIPAVLNLLVAAFPSGEISRTTHRFTC